MTGRTIGKYEVLRRIGSGGMAEVFLCRQHGLAGFEREVVVKRILERHVRKLGAIEMFLDEARISAYLHHPSVVEVFEVDSVDGLPYLAMEYLHGPSLAIVLDELARRGELPPLHMIKILSHVAEGLHHAHEAKDRRHEPLHIVHRDVSPANIVVTYDGVPKLLDFGVARARRRLVQTRAGVIRGKIGYLAPEQARNGTVDRRADVFGLGVCLFEATTGQLPFSVKGEFQILTELTAGRILEPSDVTLDYPPELEEIVLWALKIDPEERCPSCWELHLALEGYLDSRGVRLTAKDLAAWVKSVAPEPDYGDQTDATLSLPSSVPPPPRERLPSPPSSAKPRRIRAALAAGLGVALVVLGALGVIVYELTTAPDRPGPTTVAPSVPAPSPTAPAGRDDSETLEAYLPEIRRFIAIGEYPPRPGAPRARPGAARRRRRAQRRAGRGRAPARAPRAARARARQAGRGRPGHRSRARQAGPRRRARRPGRPRPPPQEP